MFTPSPIFLRIEQFKMIFFFFAVGTAFYTAKLIRAGEMYLLTV